MTLMVGDDVIKPVKQVRDLDAELRAKQNISHVTAL